MHFEDLSAYQYDLPKPLEGVMTVGWLSSSAPFQQGAVSQEFSVALKRLLITNRVNKTRGYHRCELCSVNEIYVCTGNKEKIRLGSAELWLRSERNQSIYAAPDLIWHYIFDHGYLPPVPFVDAVIESLAGINWNANEEARRLLDSAFL
ncbi:hypothetical protein [Bradyrhizobium sp. ORS 375]|uniref:DUF7919 family protein n=1 Tax=Bradyrhizobium sp. (strain ORS 375) TaxID=566679 RepID=UPI001112A4C6|nr:hypothetical protein [Bradyrhizobium sp. ORS 375]